MYFFCKYVKKFSNNINTNLFMKIFDRLIGFTLSLKNSYKHLYLMSKILFSNHHCHFKLHQVKIFSYSMRSYDDVLHIILPFPLDEDFQALIFAALCIIGAWVVFSWLIKVHLWNTQINLSCCQYSIIAFRFSSVLYGLLFYLL